jgi:hypothetical protein
MLLVVAFEYAFQAFQVMKASFQAFHVMKASSLAFQVTKASFQAFQVAKASSQASQEPSQASFLLHMAYYLGTNSTIIDSTCAFIKDQKFGRKAV